MYGPSAGSYINAKPATSEEGGEEEGEEHGEGQVELWEIRGATCHPHPLYMGG